MPNVGLQSDLAKCQAVRLLQGGDDYHQLFNASMGITHPSRKRTRTDGSVRRMEGGAEHNIEGDILVTVAQIDILTAMATPVSGQLPINPWGLNFTSRSNAGKTKTISAKLTTLSFIRPLKGFALFHIRLDIASGDVS